MKNVSSMFHTMNNMNSSHHTMVHTSHGSMDTNMVVWRKCTPFCDKTIECPEHHEMLQAIVNCTDQLGHLSNLDLMKTCIEKYQSLGWLKNEPVPDPIPSNRLPLIHWAASLGKCNALEWMLNSGFDSKVTTSAAGENALHRTIMFLYKSRPKFTTKELRPKFRKIVGLLPNLMIQPDLLNNATPFHTAATMLLNSESRLVFFQTAIDVMSTQSLELSETDRIVALDSRNNDGNTCLHILANITEKVKSEYACQAIGALLLAGADKTIKNLNDHTPLDIAISKGCNNIVDELVKIVNPTEVRNNSPTSSSHDPRSLMTMVEIPSRSRSSPISSSMVLSHSYYGDDTRRSPPIRSRSPHRDSPPMPHSKFDDHGMPEPSFIVKQEDDQRIDVVDSSQNGHPYPMSPSDSTISNFDLNSPLLNHLREAGLLTEVSGLLSRAKSRDEGQLRRYQQQAKDLDTQIVYKLKEIDRINQEVENLRMKRSRCDEEAINLRKRLSSCTNAIRELPNGSPYSQSSSASPQNVTQTNIP